MFIQFKGSIQQLIKQGIQSQQIESAINKMLNPKMFMKPAYPSQQVGKSIQIQKIGGFERTRWDEPIQVPNILYQKLKVPPPSSANQVNNINYPPSLLDFIRRAYSRCKDQAHHKLMEGELRDLIEKNKLNLQAVNWDNYPIPHNLNVTPGNQPHKAPLTSHSHQQLNSSLGSVSNPSNFPSRIIQKETIRLPSSLSNQSLLDKVQKPSNQTQSKTKQLISRKLQILQQKYQQQGNNVSQNTYKTPEKTFIGFKDQKQVKLQMLKQKYEQMSRIQEQPKPQPPRNLGPNNNNARVQGKHEGLQVVQSVVPEKVYEVKRMPEVMKKQQNKQAKAPKITKKELQSIVKVGHDQDLRTVAKRFTQFNKIKQTKQATVQQQAMEQDFQDFKIVGKCKAIDKPYLRITQRPDPQTVRPQPILRKAFNHYKAEYKKGVSYDLIICQFRSIRQDLTVQDIRNSFTVEVYEENLKISLFQDDPIQMKQCQTNLWELYRQGLYNKRSDRTKLISYHFICMILQERFKELEYMLTLIPPEVLQQRQVQQSLKLKRHLVIGNYNAFFTFYTHQDQTCQKLMNYYIDKVRVKCLVMVCKTFGEKISFKQLGQNCAQDEDVLEALAKEQKAIIIDGNLILKESYQVLKNSEYLQVKKVTSLLD